MIPMRVVVALAAPLALSAGCGCTGAHVPDDVATDDAVADAVDAGPGMDAPRVIDWDIGFSWHDTGERWDVWGWPDDGICRLDMFCQSDEDCVNWGLAVGPPGTYPSSVCMGHCTTGTVNCWTHDGVTRCQCGPTLGCGLGQLCVSDSPGGPTRCVEACQGR